MKLVRFGSNGNESPGILLGDQILDLRAMVWDIEDFDARFFANGGLDRLPALLNDLKPKYVNTADVRLGAPIARPGKIICVGENYAAHAREFGNEPPKIPILFSKATSAINGPNDDIVLPRQAHTVDSEVEIGVVIKKAAKNVSAADAMDYIAGFTILNDVSDRVAQREGPQWFRGKSHDTFCPVGPWLVTPDEIPALENVNLTCTRNGKILQAGNTADMIFDIPTLIEFISQGMTLEPGDIIATGTPPGVGSCHSPSEALLAGDTTTLQIDGLGKQAAQLIQG